MFTEIEDRFEIKTWRRHESMITNILVIIFMILLIVIYFLKANLLWLLIYSPVPFLVFRIYMYKILEKNGVETKRNVLYVLGISNIYKKERDKMDREILKDVFEKQGINDKDKIKAVMNYYDRKVAVSSKVNPYYIGFGLFLTIFALLVNDNIELLTDRIIAIIVIFITIAITIFMIRLTRLGQLFFKNQLYELIMKLLTEIYIEFPDEKKIQKFKFRKRC